MLTEPDPGQVPDPARLLGRHKDRQQFVPSALEGLSPQRETEAHRIDPIYVQYPEKANL